MSESAAQSSSGPSLSRVARVDPRSVWAHEAHSFTPWLLDNADVLADALGIDLELDRAEHPVGRYSVDLLGRDLTNDCVLIVENQLEVTDHDHLGKLVTYAAGTDAKTIVWLAPDFREEHRQAVDFLNDLGGESARFFAVAFTAIRIGDSDLAPLLEVVAEPNDWHAAVSAAARTASARSGKAEYYEQFWELFLNTVRHRHPDWTNARATNPSNWLSMPCPFKGGPNYGFSFAQGERIKSEFYIDYPNDPARVEQLFDALEARSIEIEQAYGGPLSWERLEGRRASRVADYGEGEVSRIDEHQRVVDWLIDSNRRLRAAIGSVVPQINEELN